MEAPLVVVSSGAEVDNQIPRHGSLGFLVELLWRPDVDRPERLHLGLQRRLSARVDPHPKQVGIVGHEHVLLPLGSAAP
eukprot:752852-Hanusia_phi.AAC.1